LTDVDAAPVLKCGSKLDGSVDKPYRRVPPDFGCSSWAREVWANRMIGAALACGSTSAPAAVAPAIPAKARRVICVRGD